MRRPLLAGLLFGLAGAASAEPVAVTADNFIRAESDLYFGNVVAMQGGAGRLGHEREMAALENQAVIRLNRDTLYSSVVFDLDAGPATVTLPDAEGRFMSMQVIDEDHYTHAVNYDPGSYVLTREDIGTRYVLVGLRTLANPGDPEDMAAVHALQDAVVVEQPGGMGEFEIPEWEKASQDATRTAILALGAPLPDAKGMFGTRDAVDPVRHFIGSALAWGGNPESEAMYLNRTVERNDGETVYAIEIDGAAPVDGFWSISVYNAEGYFTPNDLDAYTVNNLTAAPGADGGVRVQFGGCDGVAANCLPVIEGWNYMVRLYRPRAEALDGSWTFPDAELVQ